MRAAVVASLLLVSSRAALAQQSVDYGSISGRVTDPSGGVVVAAEVTARHAQTNVTTSTVTDGEGRFRFPYLRIGGYEVVVAQEGFESATRLVTVAAGSAFELPVVLAIGTLDASLTVTGAVPVLDVARSQVAGTLSVAEIDSLPLNGRQFLTLALLIPGVSPTNISSTQIFPETSAVPGPSISVSSQRNLSNNFVVDGLSANDDAAGLSGITYGVDAVEQFQVVTSGGQAELGRALGGHVNVVTRSGTNVLHGTVYDYVRDDSLNAQNPLSETTLPMNQHQFGASLGGPIVANRTFYFTNVEERRLDQTGLVTIADPSVAVVNARLAATGYQGPPVSTGIYPNPVDSTNVFLKVDHQASSAQQLSIRYSLYDVRSENARGVGGLSAPSASSALDNLDQSVAMSSTRVLSPQTVLETRAQFGHSNLEAPPTDLIGPAVSISGVASFGRLSTSPTGRLNKAFQVVSNLSHQAGAHAVRVGADFLYNDDLITFPRAVNGSYAFSSLANFLSGTYNNAGFSQTFGVTEVQQTNPNLGVYAQDEWKVGSRVTLNLGLRYDLQFLETINTDTNNVSPRVGVAWTPSESQTTVVRASVGLAYDRVPLRALANALLSAGNTTDLARLQQVGVSLSPMQAGAPVFPDILSGVVPSVVLPTLTTMDRDLQNAYSQQGSVEVERQVADSRTVSIGYHYLRGEHLLMAVNQNVPTCVAAGNNNGCRPNPDYANNNQYSSVGESTYHGLHVSLTQRASGLGQYRLSYTWSKAMDNVGQFFFSSPIDPTDLSKDWSRSDNDQRHRLVMAGDVRSSMEPAVTLWQHLSHGFQFGGVLQVYSQLPYNITSGVTTIQGTPGRPVVNGEFIERNAGKGEAFISLNLRLSRAFPVSGRVSLEALVEGFNLTNRTNVLTLNSNFGAGEYPTNPAPSFGQVTSVGDPRSVQFGLRVRF